MEIEKTDGKITRVEATYDAWLGFDVSNLKIDWEKTESIWCKYATLYIKMKDGTIHTIESDIEGETDFKWPTKLMLLDDKYDILWEE